MDAPVNLAILKNPYNWVIVTLMVMMAGLMVSLLFSGQTQQGNGT